jgi:hypothetical protein
MLWSLWHFQTHSEHWGMEDDETPHLMIGYFSRPELAEEVRLRLCRAPGLCRWPRGFRVGHDPLDGAPGGEHGFCDGWGEDAPRADPADVLHLPDPTPAAAPARLWRVEHFRVGRADAPPDPTSFRGIGLFSSAANAAAAIAHRRRQPGFCDWPDGFRVYRRRLDVAFGLDGFQGGYGWEAWRDSLRGTEGMGGGAMPAHTPTWHGAMS